MFRPYNLAFEQLFKKRQNTENVSVIAFVRYLIFYLSVVYFEPVHMLLFMKYCNNTTFIHLFCNPNTGWKVAVYTWPRPFPPLVAARRIQRRRESRDSGWAPGRLRQHCVGWTFCGCSRFCPLHWLVSSRPDPVHRHSHDLEASSSVSLEPAARRQTRPGAREASQVGALGSTPEASGVTRTMRPRRPRSARC